MVLDSLLHWGGVLDELDLAQRLHGWRDRGLPELADARRPSADLHVVRAIDTAGFTETPHAAARQAASGAGSASNNLSPTRPGQTAPAAATAADDGCLPLAIISGELTGPGSGGWKGRGESQQTTSRSRARCSIQAGVPQSIRCMFCGHASSSSHGWPTSELYRSVVRYIFLRCVVM